MTKILLATGNAHKAKELAALFAGHDIEVLTLRDVGFTGEIIEDGKTFEENAEIKARAAAELGYIGVGDDSGLCVDFLSGAPGIYSARYAGESCDYAKNNEKLLSEMAGGKADGEVRLRDMLRISGREKDCFARRVLRKNTFLICGGRRFRIRPAVLLHGKGQKLRRNDGGRKEFRKSQGKGNGRIFG